MTEKKLTGLVDGAKCKVTSGTHKGKTGAVTITVVQTDGERFKTLAKNVVMVK